MDGSIFKKMKVKPDNTAMVLYSPEGYSKTEDLNWQDTGQADFVHLFIESREHFSGRFMHAKESCKDGGLLWVSYPKSKGKKVYDINRDSLWDLLLAENHHPVAQVALDDNWSAVRVKRNEDGVDYAPPKNVKRGASK